MNKLITKRQEQILKIIIEEYTNSALPIGSELIIKSHLKDLSSATVRNEMVVLEKCGYLEKTHTSSGRVPSISGYKYYNEVIKQPTLSLSIKKRLKDVLSQRNSSIAEVINKSMSIINEITNLTSVISENNSNDLLKRIDLIPISKNSATVIVVSSSGNVSNNLITLDKESRIDDIAICVRIFNDRLIDTKLKDIREKIKSIEPLIKSQIKEYEYVLQEIIEKIFKSKENMQSRILGFKNMVMQPEFRDAKELEKVLTFLEDATVWKQIAHNQEKTGKTMINFGQEIGLPNSMVVASTLVHTPTKDHSLSVVGPTRMDYGTVKSLLDFIKAEIENNWGNENE